MFAYRQTTTTLAIFFTHRFSISEKDKAPQFLKFIGRCFHSCMCKNSTRLSYIIPGLHASMTRIRIRKKISYQTRIYPPIHLNKCNNTRILKYRHDILSDGVPAYQRGPILVRHFSCVHILAPVCCTA